MRSSLIRFGELAFVGGAVASAIRSKRQDGKAFDPASYGPSGLTLTDSAGGATLQISGGVLTSKWLEGSDLEQVVEFAVSNTHDTNYLTWADHVEVIVESASLETTTPATLLRLGPDQKAFVQVGVKNKEGVTPGTQCDAQITATWGSSDDRKTSSHDISGKCGIGDYEATESSLSHHWNPDWFNEIKYGIFIHWGLYAAPGYGNEPGPNQDYAEW